MAKGRSSRVRIAVVIFASFGAVLAGIPATADAQIAVGARGENRPARTALARSMKEFGTSPRDFNSLITAGRASLALGDTQAAQGFFGRADEVGRQVRCRRQEWGQRSPRKGDERWRDAVSLREAVSARCDAVRRSAGPGVAYDLMGQHSMAQADYRSALYGTRWR